MPMDTAEYLASQGWKGKGTAVVQKKTLGGVGKDRDEAVPFWDNIFAAAAINIKVSSEAPTPVTSGTATPVEDEPLAPSKHTSSMNAFARGKKEMARRLLYSKFFRGDVLVSEDLDKIPGPSSSTRPMSNGMEAGSSMLLAGGGRGVSASLPTTSRSTTTSPDSDAEDAGNASTASSSNEPAEAKARQRAEKAAKRAAKEKAKAVKLLKKEAKARKRAEKGDRGSMTVEEKEERRRAKGKGKEGKRGSEVALPRDTADGEDGKKKRKRSRLDLAETLGQGSDDVAEKTETALPRKKKKKRETGECVAE
ncbi:hypothetical protein QFC22_005450 [Naganishia vaughanmartiniae]|uniref:Uncharacterized protein n=1 Tax=Naganishia vaughanmartiniae TaxID=1424756 RepID=A0ACC2WTM9_9TREE|nr:hypothetical protein QFC22_005450 [Naganishia vaughanmartiniae]